MSLFSIPETAFDMFSAIGWFYFAELESHFDWINSLSKYSSQEYEKKIWVFLLF